MKILLKILKGLYEIIRVILFIIIVVSLAVILTQRVSNNKKSVAGYRVFTIVTESMVPEYLVGDTILIKNIEPSKLKVGDDITYLGEEESFKGKIVTHRVIDISKSDDGTYTITTKGIANDKEDPKITSNQVYGKVIYKIKSISYLNSIIGNLYGMYFIIFIPLTLMIFHEFSSYKKDKKIEGMSDEESNKEIVDDFIKEDTHIETIENTNKKELKDKMKSRRKNRREKRRKKRKSNE